MHPADHAPGTGRDAAAPRAAGRPGWPEIAAGLATYLILIAILAAWMLRTPDERAALRGIVGMAANGAAGVVALGVAVALRIRDVRAFGFRTVGRNWLLAGAGLGLVAFGLSFLIEHVYFLFVTEPNTQADFQAAARGGAGSLVLLLMAGALLTPLGEEVLFRGVVANALDRYGRWVGVIGSATIFAVAHGPSVILLDAFMVGILAGILLRRTGSLWPGVTLHASYNGLHLLYYSAM